LDIIRITAELGSILIAFRRPIRKTLHLANAWLRCAAKFVAIGVIADIEQA
jgi:hypothetical protein